MLSQKEREILGNQLDEITKRITVIDHERKSLEQKLKVILPIKEGEKVDIVNAQTQEHIRFAFIRKITISPPNEKRSARVNFDLEKCKKDGTKSNQTDWLRHGQELIKKIY